MVVDTIGKGKSNDEGGVECQAAAATLSLNPNYSITSSCKATSPTNTQFSDCLYESIIY